MTFAAEVISPTLSSSSSAAVRHPSGSAEGIRPKPFSKLSTDELDAALSELHAERRSLLRLRRADELTASDAGHLREVEAHIAHLEMQEERARGGAIWAKLDELAERILGAQSRLRGGRE